MENDQVFLAEARELARLCWLSIDPETNVESAVSAAIAARTAPLLRAIHELRLDVFYWRSRASLAEDRIEK